MRCSSSSSPSPLPSDQLHQALAMLRSCFITGPLDVLLDPTINSTFVNSINLLLRHSGYLSVDQRASFCLALSSQGKPREQLQLRRTKEVCGQELKARLDSLLSQQSSTIEHVFSLVDNTNSQIAEIKRVEAHLQKLKQNLQHSSVELEKVMDQDSLHSEEIPCLKGEPLTCEAELKDSDQVIDTWWSLLASIFS